jgi:hypothetical protein
MNEFNAPLKKSMLREVAVWRESHQLAVNAEE